MPDLKWICPDRPRRKMPMSRSSQNQSASVQIIPDRNCICPYFRAFMSRPSCAPNYIRAFNAKFLVCPCPDHRAFISRFSCVCQNEKKLHPVLRCIFLEDEDREGSKFPQIQIFTVYQKILF